MTNSSPPPVIVPPELDSPFMRKLTDAVYEMWYSLGGQQDGVIFEDRISFGSKTTDDLPEGSTNLYFNGKDTDDLPEGSTNFYYTQERQDDIEAFVFFVGA